MMRLKVVKITEEPKEQGPIVLRIKVLCNGEYYIFGAKKVHYLDERNRKSIQETWFKTIKEIQAEKNEKDKETPKGKKLAKELIRLGTEDVIEDE
jgi:hypothetical protein